MSDDKNIPQESAKASKDSKIRILDVGVSLNEAEELVDLGKVKESYQIIEGIKNLPNLSKDHYYRVKLLESRLMLFTGKYIESIELATEILHELTNKSLPMEYIDAQIIIISALWRQGNFEASLNTIYQVEQQLSLLEQKNRSETNKRKHIILHQKGTILWQKGNLDSALECFLESKQIREQIGNLRDIAQSLNNIGGIFGSLGELNRSAEYFEQALELFQKLGNKQGIAGILHNLGELNARRGELDKGLQYLERSLAIKREIGNKQYIASTLNTLGEVYAEKGDYINSVKCIEESLALFKELGNNNDFSMALYSVISVNINKGNYISAQKFVDQLYEFSLKQQNKGIDQRYQVCKAMILKAGINVSGNLTFISLHDTLGKLIEAGNLLRNIITDRKAADYVLTVDAIFNLCEILVLELKTLGNATTLNEINQLTQQLIQIGEKEHLYSLTAQTYLLQAKLELLKANIESARNYLARARAISIEKGYDRLGNAISSEQKRLEGHIPTWLVQDNTSLLERIEKTQLEGLVISLRQNRVENFIETQIQTQKPDLKDLQAFAQELTKQKVKWD